MPPFPNYYNGWEECAKGLSSTKMVDNGGLSLSSRSMAEAKSIAACKSHSEAERRRRERINGHLTTLRTLLPNTTKTDKATLLGEVVQHVKELKKIADGMVEKEGEGCREWPFPGETDEVTLGYCEGEARLIRASLCCDDREDLLSDLTKALRSVRVRVVKAEMATVGRRTKSVFVLQGGDDDFGTLRRALKAVVDKPAFSSALGQVLPGKKLAESSLANSWPMIF